MLLKKMEVLKHDRRGMDSGLLQRGTRTAEEKRDSMTVKEIAVIEGGNRDSVPLAQPRELASPWPYATLPQVSAAYAR